MIVAFLILLGCLIISFIGASYTRNNEYKQQLTDQTLNKISLLYFGKYGDNVPSVEVQLDFLTQVFPEQTGLKVVEEYRHGRVCAVKYDNNRVLGFCVYFLAEFASLEELRECEKTKNWLEVASDKVLVL